MNDLDDRINRLVSQFNGMIKYFPMIQDHPDWTDDQCIEFAKKWHAVAIEKYNKNSVGWNSGVPYCRNVYKQELA